MPVILSDETWARIQKMLTDYESGVLRVIPGEGLKLEEQVSVKASCPGTKMSIDLSHAKPQSFGFGTLNLNVCIGGNSVAKDFLTRI